MLRDSEILRLIERYKYDHKLQKALGELLRRREADVSGTTERKTLDAIKAILEDHLGREISDSMIPGIVMGLLDDSLVDEEDDD